MCWEHYVTRTQSLDSPIFQLTYYKFYAVFTAYDYIDVETL